MTILFPVILSSQTTKKVDSLKNVIAETGQDTTRILALIALSKEYTNQHNDSAVFFSKKALNLAQKAEMTDFVAASYVSLAEIEVRRDSLNQAKTFYLEAIKSFQLADDELNLPDLYLKLGSLSTYQNDEIQALTYFQEALAISEKHNLTHEIEKTCNNLGSVYKNLKKYDQALECFNRALIIADKLGLKNDVYYIYGNLGILNAMTGNMELAEGYFMKTLDIALEMKDQVVEAFARTSLGDFHLDLKKYPKALQYYSEALALSDVINTRYSGPKSIFFANVYKGIGTAHFYLGNYDTAIEILRKGFDKAQETGQLSIVADCAGLLSEAYEKQNKLALALKYSRIYKSMSDSTLNEDLVRRVTEMDMQNKFDKLNVEREYRQALNDAAQKRNKIIYLMMIGGSVLGLVIFLLLFLLQKSKIKRERLAKKNLELEKENLTNDLEYKNKELTTNVLFMLRKNELIHGVCEKLKKVKMNIKVENRKVIEDVISELETASKGDTWKEFELRFKEVHNDFYKKLNELYPDLTPGELKLCAFLRLNMSSKDIAAITFLSINGINIARHRLRKKLNIEQDENLITFLSSL